MSRRQRHTQRTPDRPLSAFIPEISFDGTRMRAISAALLAWLIGFQASAAAPADAPSSDADPAVLAIDAGRLGAMVDRTADALKFLAPSARDDTTAQEPAQTGPVFPELVYAVRRYNILVGEACSAGIVGMEFCANPYAPTWLGDAPDASYGNAALRAMIDDATAHLEPFWSLVCAKATRASKDEAFCQLE
jgi:hypothetical protein